MELFGKMWLALRDGHGKQRPGLVVMNSCHVEGIFAAELHQLRLWRFLGSRGQLRDGAPRLCQVERAATQPVCASGSVVQTARAQKTKALSQGLCSSSWTWSPRPRLSGDAPSAERNSDIRDQSVGLHPAAGSYRTQSSRPPWPPLTTSAPHSGIAARAGVGGGHTASPSAATLSDRTGDRRGETAAVAADVAECSLGGSWWR